MQVFVESTGDLERRMTVALPADQFEKAILDRLKGLSKTVKMPGFRPGKVPLKMIEAQYGGKVMEEVVGDLINSSFQQAIGQQGLNPAGGPSIEPKSLDRGKDLEYVAVFEIYPDVNPKDLGGTKFERPLCEITQEDIHRTLERMQKQRTQWEPVDDSAQDGHRLSIDFDGSLDGKPVDGTSAKDFKVILGQGALVKDLEGQLVGLGVGDKPSISVVFPDDYHDADLAGKKVDFAISVNQIAEAKLPALDDDFAKVFGIKDGSLETLKAEVKNNLEREVQDRIRVLMRDRVMSAVVDNNDISVPKRLVDEEARRLLSSNRQTLKQNGVPEDKLPSDESLYIDQAQRRVLLGLVLSEISKRQGMKADPAQVQETLERMAATYEDPAQFIQWHYADPKRLAEVEAVVMEDMLVEHLLQTAQIVDKPIDFNELMYPKQPTDNT
ncbi:MAG TPA: trigger factor [Acidiferrobacteraceae bacterium]|nr:trigger factor [Acidiferrobacteraceae bacterium]